MNDDARDEIAEPQRRMDAESAKRRGERRHRRDQLRRARRHRADEHATEAVTDEVDRAPFAAASMLGLGDDVIRDDVMAIGIPADVGNARSVPEAVASRTPAPPSPRSSPPPSTTMRVVVVAVS